MRKYVVVVFLIILSFPLLSQNVKYEYRGRFTPEIKVEKLKEARFINQIMPEFIRRFSLPYRESTEFRDLTSVLTKSTAYYNYPQGNYVHLRESYETIIEYIGIEITCQNDGLAVIARSSDDILTAQQKEILHAADPGSDILIKIRFRYKAWVHATYKSSEDLHEGTYKVTLVPETEAEYPGGIGRLSAFITDRIFYKLSDSKQISKLLESSVKFTVNESGNIENIRIVKSSFDKELDILILNAFEKMPKWKPARDLKGHSVKQEFVIPFDSSVGC
jgi:TonB family protein